MSLLGNPEAWLGLLTLTVLEIVLGIDNIIFISILAGKLPQQHQGRARRLGLVGAMLTRIALLAALAWIIRLTAPLFHLLGHPFSGRDLILIGGGLFLIAKSTREIHEGLEGDAGRGGREPCGEQARAPITATRGPSPWSSCPAYWMSSSRAAISSGVNPPPIRSVGFCALTTGLLFLPGGGSAVRRPECRFGAA